MNHKTFNDALDTYTECYDVRQNNPHPQAQEMKDRYTPMSDAGGILFRWFGSNSYRVGKWTEEGLRRVYLWKNYSR